MRVVSVERFTLHACFAGNDLGAQNDIALGAIPCGGPTEPPCSVSLDYIVNELRLGVGASDAYIAGYLSVVFG